MGLPNIGPLELIIVLAIALLIVGPRRLPEMGNAVGRTIREFRKASSGVTDPFAPEPEPDKGVTNVVEATLESTGENTGTAATASAGDSRTGI